MADPEDRESKALDSSGGLDRRSAVARDLAGITPKIRDSEITEEIDGRLYVYKREANCKVCRLPDALRDYVDLLILYPKSLAETHEKASAAFDEAGVPPDVRPSYQSIRRHSKNHLPADKLFVREVVERRAAEEGRRVLEGRDRLLTGKALLEVIVQRGWESLVSGTAMPTVFETMTASERLEKLEKESSGDLNIQSLLAQLNVIIGVVRNRVPKDLWDVIADDIRRIQQDWDSGQSVIEAHEVEEDLANEPGRGIPED